MTAISLIAITILLGIAIGIIKFKSIKIIKNVEKERSYYSDK